ncbi:hypothetical protein GJ496_003608 [Pomphorhynchus laevis]|nr:hypothetical protein GJ496_003608 [Pomphorhynchus laevis]
MLSSLNDFNISAELGNNVYRNVKPILLKTDRQNASAEVVKIITICFGSILIIVGVIGNCLSIATLTSRKFKGNITAALLALFSFINIGNVFVGLLGHVIRFGFDINIRKTNMSCKLHLYLTYAFIHLSSHVLMLLSLQRYLLICHRTIHFKFERQYTFWKLVLTYILLILLSDWHFPTYYKISNSDSGRACTVNNIDNPLYYKFRNHYYPIISFVGYTCIPFAVLVITGLLIIRKVKSTSKTITNRTSSKQRSLTVMTLATCLFFISLNTPVNCYFVANERWQFTRRYYNLEWTIVILIFYINHACTFFIYVLSGREFRREFIQLFNMHINAHKKNKTDKTGCSESHSQNLYTDF